MNEITKHPQCFKRLLVDLDIESQENLISLLSDIRNLKNDITFPIQNIEPHIKDFDSIIIKVKNYERVLTKIYCDADKIFKNMHQIGV